MPYRNPLYRVVATISVVFILYALVNNYVIDPGAERFLSHKTELERELNLPVWLNVMYVHVAFACIAMAAGLLNFSNSTFEKSRKLHRMIGYVYILSVLVVVLTSGYMAPYATGGKISSMGFNAINILWLIVTVTALVQIKKKRIAQHRRWMIRSYIFCYTNMSIHLIAALFQRGLGYDYAASYTIGIYGTIALLPIIPEVYIRAIRWGRWNDRTSA